MLDRFSTVRVVLAVALCKVAVIVVVPVPTALIVPVVASTVATLVSELCQFTAVPTGTDPPSLYWAVTRSVSVDPTAMLAVLGSVSPVKVEGLTVSGTDPVAPVTVAEMVVNPAPCAVATPIWPVVPKLAALVLLLPHIANDVITWVVPSLNEPTAVNGSRVYGSMVSVEGAMARVGFTVALLTVSVTLFVTDPEVAEMVVVPAATPAATPTIEIMATPVCDEAQVTPLGNVRSPPSLYIPKATNGWLVPAAMVTLPPEITIEFKVGGATVSVVVPFTEPELAVMVLVPSARAVRYPADVMVAKLSAEDVHVAVLVRSFVLPSE